MSFSKKFGIFNKVPPGDNLFLMWVTCGLDITMDSILKQWTSYYN